MANEIGSIEVVLELNESDFAKGLKTSEKSLNSFEKSAKKTTAKTSQSFKQGFNQIASAGKQSIGGLLQEIPLVGQAVSGISTATTTLTGSTAGLTSAMGLLGGAVAGVGAAAVALTGVSLVSYFTGTQDGADSLAKTMNRVDFALGAVQTGFQNLGRAIANAIPTFDLEDILPQDIITRADELTRATKEAEEFRLNNTVKVAKLETEIANQIFKTRELNRPYEERKEALDEAGRLIQQQFAIERQLLQNQLEVVQAQNNNTESLRQDLQLEKDLEAQIERKNKAQIQALKEIQNRQNEAYNSEQARINKLAAEEKKRDDERVKVFTASAEQALKNYESEQAIIKNQTQAYAQAFSGIGEIAKSAFGQATTAAEQFAQQMGGIVIDLIAQQFGASIANAITGATGAAAAAGPFAPAVLPATIASMTGAVISAFASIPSFASGGTYRHSEAGQSENIIPTNRMPEVMAGFGQQNDRPIVVSVNGKALLTEMVRQSQSDFRTQGNSTQWR